MNGKFRKNRRILIILVVLVVLMVSAICLSGWRAGQNGTGVEQETPVKGSIQTDALDAVRALVKTAEGQNFYKEEYAAPHNIITEATGLSDVYTVSGSTVQLQCYYPEAKSYKWEVYDCHTCIWGAMDGETLQDELYRPVSVLHVAVEGTDTTSVRCTIHLDDGETVTENASIYIIPEIQEISVEEYVTDAGTYISGMEIPVHVLCDGTEREITGLYGLTFVESAETREISASGSGNLVETVTTVHTECSYAYIGLEDKEFVLRYRCGDQIIDTGIRVSGKDLCAPVISDVSVSGFEITCVDVPVTASISITAEDDRTPGSDLEYAFIPLNEKGETQPADTDWIRQPVFSLDITQNGTWAAFCRDQGGNMASMEKEVIVVDQKAPVMSVRLADTGWCSSTKLVIDAEDYLPIDYRILAPDGTDSGWTTQNEHEVNCNGTWEVQARDSAGNVSSESVTVTNIDRQAPVIEKITTSPAEGGSNSNED